MDNTTELLLQKARERRAAAQAGRKPVASGIMSRERTGSIASGISSPPLKRRVVEGIASPRNPAVSPMGSGVRGGVRGLAGGIKGRPISAVPVVQEKAVPIAEVEDDFELLQERMKNRFKKTESDTKENLLSPNPGLFSPTNKKSFFNNPTSPVSSPKKKFFAPVEKEEPVYAVVSKPEPKITKSIINDMSYQSPTKLNRSPSRALSPNREQALSPTREPLSPSRQALTPTKSFSQTSTSPSRGRANSPVRPLSSASFKKFGDQVKRSPTPERRANHVLSPERNIEHAVRTTSREPTAPARSVSLRQSPSMRQVEKLVEPTEVLETKHAVLQKPKITVKPNSVVSRALARLEKKGQEEDEEEMEVEECTIGNKPANCPGSPNVLQPNVEPDSFMVLCNDVMGDISTLRRGTKGKAVAPLPEMQEEEEESMSEEDCKPAEEGSGPAKESPKKSNILTVTPVGTPVGTPLRVAAHPAPKESPERFENVPFASPPKEVKFDPSPAKQIWNKEDLNDLRKDNAGTEELNKSNVSDMSDEWLSFDSPSSNNKREEFNTSTPVTKLSFTEEPSDVYTSPHLTNPSATTPDTTDLTLTDPLSVTRSSIPTAKPPRAPTAILRKIKTNVKKKEVSCLAESVFSSMGDLTKITPSTEDLTTSPSRNTPLSPSRREALSPSHSTRQSPRQALSPVDSVKRPQKKLRRSMSVSDISASPSKFVRLESLRCSNKALESQASRRRSPRLVERVSTLRHRKKANRTPLDEGTLDLRPPFDQVKVLEEGILIQTQLEAQAAQLLEHCNSGLEQVETEKVLLLAGLKKELWQYHLNELKNDTFKYQKSEKAKGAIVVKDITLLLRQDYLVNKVVDMKTNQSFFAVIKIAPYRLIATTTATSQSNISGSNLVFTDVISIENLPPDFSLTVEVYNMQYNEQAQPTTPQSKKKQVQSNTKSTPKRLLQTALSKMSQKNKLEKAGNFSSSMDNFKQTKTSKRGASFVLAGSLVLRIKDVSSTSFRLRRKKEGE